MIGYGFSWNSKIYLAGKPLDVTIHHDEDGLWSEVPSLPGCFGAGDTVAELLNDTVASATLYLESLVDLSGEDLLG